jgi:hypothetical protein
MGRNSARLSVNIDVEAREILDRVAASALFHEAKIPPVGRVINEMVYYLEEDNEWETIEQRVLNVFVREVEQRKKRDRRRKRKGL